MASRENQGLHLALILLVMVTVILCIVSFVFYSKAQTRYAEAQEAKNRMAEFKSAANEANSKAQILTYMISGQGKTLSEISDELANLPGSDDQELSQIRSEYRDNMLLFGPADQEYEAGRNYESLPSFLLSRIRDLNEQLTDLRRTEAQLTQEKADLEASTQARIEKAEEARDAARNDLAAEREKFSEDLAALRTELEKVAEESSKKDDRIAELTAQLEDQRKELDERIETLTKRVKDLRTQRRKSTQTSFASPDAVVTSVNQKEGILYIDVGSADNLNVQQTFSVFDEGTTGIMNAEPKGRIEVLQILGEHLAMCRILEDQVANIITPGDLVFTPAWSPGQRIHIAIAGVIDITGDGRTDRDLLKKLIELNGGAVDETVSVQTRYLVQGELPGGGPNAEMAQVQSSKESYNEKVNAAIEIGVTRIDVDKLLALMGWRADISTVTMGSGRAESVPEAKPQAQEGEESPFRKRTPPRGDEGAF